MAEAAQTNSISFPFQLFKQESREHVVEKADATGTQRRYIRGISSGVRVDGDGERMTGNALSKMQTQAKSGDILLFAGKHGVNFQDDIGILTDSEIINGGQDWFTEYRLFDEFDDVGQTFKEQADKVWKQVLGLPPYNRPRQYGFSIEALIPEGGIVQQTVANDGRMKRVIDDIELEGVVLVTKPSYANVATAIYKALGELHPDYVGKLHKQFENNFLQQMQDEETRDSFYRRYYAMNDALMDSVERIMGKDDGRREERLSILFSEFTPAMIQHILQHEGAFQRDKAQAADELEKDRGLEELMSKMSVLQTLIQKRMGGSK